MRKYSRTTWMASAEDGYDAGGRELLAKNPSGSYQVAMTNIDERELAELCKACFDALQDTAYAISIRAFVMERKEHGATPAE